MRHDVSAGPHSNGGSLDIGPTHHRILVSGSRGWTNRRLVYDTLRSYMAQVLLQPGAHRFIIVHGGARGADEMAGQFANKADVSEEVHFAKWSQHGKRAGFLRNQQMVARGAEVHISFWDGESVGTKSTIDLSIAAGIPTWIVSPDGEREVRDGVDRS